MNALTFAMPILSWLAVATPFVPGTPIPWFQCGHPAKGVEVRQLLILADVILSEFPIPTSPDQVYVASAPLLRK